MNFVFFKDFIMLGIKEVEKYYISDYMQHNISMKYQNNRNV